jgi:hypothetical protein
MFRATVRIISTPLTGYPFPHPALWRIHYCRIISMSAQARGMPLGRAYVGLAMAPSIINTDWFSL